MILKSIFTLLLAVVVIVLVAVLVMNREQEAPSKPTPQSTMAKPATDKYRLLVGKQFPSAQVLSLTGQTVNTDDLLMRGRVVLFLEPGCVSCDNMVIKWTTLVSRQMLSNEELFGICFLPPKEAADYAERKDLKFPIYCDTALYFLNNHDVTEFPLQLVVGKSGKIYESTFDVNQQVFQDQLRRWLSE